MSKSQSEFCGENAFPRGVTYVGQKYISIGVITYLNTAQELCILFDRECFVKQFLELFSQWRHEMSHLYRLESERNVIKNHI